MLSTDDTDHRRAPARRSPLLLAVLAAPMAQASAASSTPRATSPGSCSTGVATRPSSCGARVETAPMGINNRGEIAGAYDDGKSDHGFMRDRRGRITTIDVPGARGTAASEDQRPRPDRRASTATPAPTRTDAQSAASCWSAASSPGSMSRTRCNPGPRRQQPRSGGGRVHRRRRKVPRLPVGQGAVHHDRRARRCHDVRCRHQRSRRDRRRPRRPRRNHDPAAFC